MLRCSLISSANQIQSPDEEDFDQFLENVKARSLSVQKQGEHQHGHMMFTRWCSHDVFIMELV